MKKTKIKVSEKVFRQIKEHYLPSYPGLKRIKDKYPDLIENYFEVGGIRFIPKKKKNKCADCGALKDIKFLVITDCYLCDNCEKDLSESFEYILKRRDIEAPEL